MASTNSTSNSGGISFPGALTIAFIVLKLTHVISWSWWWVLSPLWVVWGIVLIIGIIWVLLYFLDSYYVN